jgi:hypothetical protein
VSTRSAFIAGANAGGILQQVFVNGGTAHEIAVIHANAKSVTYVSWGKATTDTWAQWYTFAPGYLTTLPGVPSSSVAVTWA